MCPSTATRRPARAIQSRRLQRRRHRFGVRVVRVVQDGEPGPRPERLHPPCRDPRALQRRGAFGGCESERDPDGGRGECVRDHVLAGDRRAPRARAPRRRTAGTRHARRRRGSTSSARTSASASTPNVRTRALATSAYPRTIGSSTFRTATPSDPSHATGSAPAATIASHEPNTPMCATPMFVTTTTSGRATSHSRATSPSSPRAHLGDDRLDAERRAEQGHRQPHLVVERRRARMRREAAWRAPRRRGPSSTSCRWRRSRRPHAPASGTARPPRGPAARVPSRAPPRGCRRDPGGGRAPPPPRDRTRRARSRDRRIARRRARRTRTPARSSRLSVATPETAPSGPVSVPPTAAAISASERGITIALP